MKKMIHKDMEYIFAHVCHSVCVDIMNCCSGKWKDVTCKECLKKRKPYGYNYSFGRKK